jgi:hypothetical protein
MLDKCLAMLYISLSDKQHTNTKDNTMKTTNNTSAIKAKEFYNMSGYPSSVETHVIKTKNGNFVYQHLTSGNSPQPTRVYNPSTGEDKLHENQSYFGYLAHITRVPITYKMYGFLIGQEVVNYKSI